MGPVDANLVKGEQRLLKCDLKIKRQKEKEEERVTTVLRVSPSVESEDSCTSEGQATESDADTHNVSFSSTHLSVKIPRSAI